MAVYIVNVKHKFWSEILDVVITKIKSGNNLIVYRNCLHSLDIFLLILKSKSNAT